MLSTEQSGELFKKEPDLGTGLLNTQQWPQCPAKAPPNFCHLLSSPCSGRSCLFVFWNLCVSSCQCPVDTRLHVDGDADEMMVEMMRRGGDGGDGDDDEEDGGVMLAEKVTKMPVVLGTLMTAGFCFVLTLWI